MRIANGMIAFMFGLLIATPSLAADVVLNEYNAVGGTDQLDGGKGADSFFGTILGNGGNWFELMVVGDHVDMRGWKLAWTEDEQIAAGGTSAGTITLSDASIWSDLRSGSLITLIETANAGGAGAFNSGTDLSYNPQAGDWWINVSTQQEAAKGAAAVATTTTNDGAPGDFSVGKSDWTLTILNAAGANVFGPVGEGAKWGDGISGTEAGKLEGPQGANGAVTTLADWQAIVPGSALYDDSGSTSFGAINADYDTATKIFTAIQDVKPLRDRIGGVVVAGDFNGDGRLTDADIDALSNAVLAASTDTKFDVDKSGTVNGNDRTAWVETLKRTYFGDANLDGQFTTTDLVTVLSAGQYEDAVAGNSTWATGDWNGDKDFTTSDLVTALQGGGYESGPRAAVSAVPEPTGLALLLSASIFDPAPTLGLILR